MPAEGVLLSVDWDAYSGCAEFVFDAPIWGTPDREHDRLAAWRERARRRAGPGWAEVGWAVLEPDFPLSPGWQELLAYAGRPTFVAWSHAHARAWLERFPGRTVLNIDSHHDLVNRRGDSGAWRPGNWAGLGLAGGLVDCYTVRYPEWHRELAVAEGHDLERTWTELCQAHLPPALLDRVTLERGSALPPATGVESLLLVQSPAWTSPAHDPAFFSLLAGLGAVELTPPLLRPA